MVCNALRSGSSIRQTWPATGLGPTRYDRGASDPEALQQVCGSGIGTPSQPIALHEPDFNGTQAWAYVRDCLDSGWVSTAGRWVSRFEQELCAPQAPNMPWPSRTALLPCAWRLHLVVCRLAMRFCCRPLSFVATANAVAHLGAMPHFVDVEAGSLGLDPVVAGCTTQLRCRTARGRSVQPQHWPAPGGCFARARVRSSRTHPGVRAVSEDWGTAAW